MSEVIEPLDIADAAAVAEGAITFDDARALEADDDLHPQSGPDSERLVVWDEVHDSDMEPEEEPGIEPYLDDLPIREDLPVPGEP